MRLLVDGSIHAGRVGGIQVYLERVVEALSLRHSVTVLTSVPERLQPLGCQTIRIPKWTRTPRGRTLWELTLLPRHCSSRFDALLCVTPIAPPTHTPVISVVHDLTPLILRADYPTKTKGLFSLGLGTLRMADAIITVSRHTQRDLARLKIVNPKNVFVAYNGVQNNPVATSVRAFDRYRPYLLYVGSHKPNKNLCRLVQAFGSLHGHRDMRLVIAGTDEPRYLTATERAISAIGLQDRVIVMRDGLPPSDMSSLYASATGFIHPSLYEGFGIPLAEAMAHGVPCAASSTSSLPEVGGNAVIYFDPLSIDDIRIAMHRLLDDDTLRARLSAAGPIQASQFTWERTARAITTAVITAKRARRRD